MQINQVEEWQRLTEHYRGMLDGELEQLAESFSDLTETAQQVLRSELRSRGLDVPDARKIAGRYATSFTTPGFSGSADPYADEGRSNRRPGNVEDDSPRDYTWKTPLCECETSEEAYQLKQVLQRAGIDSWVEGADARNGGYSKILVAADQLEEAIEIAGQPIPQEIVEESKTDVPEYVPPKCPKCGAEDPVLESTNPTNSWRCEACDGQWSDPELDADGNAPQAGR